MAMSTEIRHQHTHMDEMSGKLYFDNLVARIINFNILFHQAVQDQMS
jgi:hypothetical protein